MKVQSKLMFGASLLAIACAAAAQVKVGVIQGLSGPPAIVDFGESYLQGIRLALKDHQASGAKVKIELQVYDDEANPQRAVALAVEPELAGHGDRGGPHVVRVPLRQQPHVDVDAAPAAGRRIGRIENGTQRGRGGNRREAAFVVGHVRAQQRFHRECRICKAVNRHHVHRCGWCHPYRSR